MKPGERIRDYILERKLGEGGMGEVWLARHALLGKPLAIKVMAEGLAADPKFRERFLTEARAMAALQHPHIVGATDFFEERDRMFLVMPFVEGRSLSERLDASGGPLGAEEALGVSRDILGALDYAHRKGVIHRDVKPSNILVDRDGRGYLTDFGIALIVGDTRKTKTGLSVGTPHYMSPEQIERPKQVDHRTDVYSFGCVLFEMLCGRPPFVGDAEGEGSDFQVRRGHVMERPPELKSLNHEVPDWLEAVVLRALEKDTAMRYRGCGEFLKALADGEARPAGAVTGSSGQGMRATPSRKATVPEYPQRGGTTTEAPRTLPPGHDHQAGVPPANPERPIGRTIFIGIVLLMAISFVLYLFYSVNGAFPPLKAPGSAPDSGHEATPSRGPAIISERPLEEGTGQPQTGRGRSILAAAEADSFADRFCMCNSDTQNADGLLSLYADRVDFFGAGVVGKERILSERRNYVRRWLEIRFEKVGTVEVVSLGGGRYSLTFDLDFEAANASRGERSRGRARETLVVEEAGGSLKIVDEKQKILHNEKTAY